MNFEPSFVYNLDFGGVGGIVLFICFLIFLFTFDDVVDDSLRVVVVVGKYCLQNVLTTLTTLVRGNVDSSSV